MARSYAVTDATTGGLNLENSATVPQAQIVSAATVRPKLYDLVVGSEATPADQAAEFCIRRSTTASTGGTAITPSPIDPADPASLSAAMVSPSMSAPTLTAGLFLLKWAQNLRATFRWVAAPGKEIVAPATAANGLTWLNTAATAVYKISYCLQFEE